MDDINTHRRDYPDMKPYMGTEKDSYGSKDTMIKFDPNEKKDPSKRLWYWTRIVSRYNQAENQQLTPNTDSAWRAFNSDIVNRQAKIKKHPESEIADDINKGRSTDSGTMGRPIVSYSEFE